MAPSTSSSVELTNCPSCIATPSPGASRSLGLGYTRALLAARPEARVVAAARNPSSAPDLQALAKEDANKDRVYLLQLDVEDKEQVAKAAKELEASGFLQNGLDALIHNAGVALNHQVKPSQLRVSFLALNLWHARRQTRNLRR